MNYDELDDLVDLARETIAASREENARIKAFQNEQPVTWDQYSYEYIDWREHA